MVTITFPNRDTEKRALAFLLGRFSGRVLTTGEHMVPEAALEALASQNIEFTVKARQHMSSKWRRFEVLLPSIQLRKSKHDSMSFRDRRMYAAVRLLNTDCFQEKPRCAG